MAEVKGIIVTCDRCPETTIRKYLGEGELDGGYTKLDKYEPMPEGWTSHYWLNLVKNGTVIFCPKCTEKMKTILNAFIQRRYINVDFKKDEGGYSD